MIYFTSLLLTPGGWREFSSIYIMGGMQGSSQKKIKEGVVLRSKHIVVFLTTSKRFCLRKGGGLPPLWLDPWDGWHGEEVFVIEYNDHKSRILGTNESHKQSNQVVIKCIMKFTVHICNLC